MTAVYVIRHPQTTWNVEQRYQGRLESPLSDEGRAQARLLCRSFVGQRIDAVYSSPLQRALHLARDLAAASDSPLRVDHRLTEIGQTPWEGFTSSEIRSRCSELHDEWYRRPDRVQFAHGENLVMVRRRILSVLNDVRARFPRGSVAIVTHSVVIQTLAAAAFPLDLRYIHHVHVGNASVTTLCGEETEGGLLTLNDLEPLYHSPVSAAVGQGCETWARRSAAQ